MVRRSTLINVLKACASSPFGVSRSDLNRMNGSLDISGHLVAVRDSPWPMGLRHLVSEERIPTKGMCRIAWMITSAARQLLRDIQVNPDAQPIIPRGNSGFQSMLARQYAARKALKARRRKKLSKKRHQSLKHPKHHGVAYDSLPTDVRLLRVDPNSAAFRNLSPLVKIQILRAKVRAKQF